MANQQQAPQTSQTSPAQPGQDQARRPGDGNARQGDQSNAQQAAPADFDGLKDKKPDELTPEELRLMADTMPGEGPGD